MVEDRRKIMVHILFNALVKMSFQGIIIIAVILLVRFFLKKLKVEHKYLVGMWLIVFFYFIFPWKVSLPIGFWSFSNVGLESQILSSEQITSNERNDKTDIVQNNDLEIENLNELQGNDIKIESLNKLQENISKTEKFQENNTKIESLEELEQNNKKANRYLFLKNNILPYLWLLVFVCLLGHLLFSYYNMKKKLLLSIPYKENIWWAEEIDMPIVFGCVVPKIYLPLSIQEEDMRYIITHESMHIERRDYLIKMMAYIICLLHWFNPFVWMAYFLLADDIEKACDEAVIQSIGEENRKEYAYALLHFLSGNSVKRIFAAPICFNEGDVKSRIQNIMKYKVSIHKIGKIVILLGILLAVSFMTQTKSEEEHDSKESYLNNSELTNMQIGQNEIINIEETISNKKENIPSIYVSNLENIQVGNDFSLEDCYMKECDTEKNHFYIDENGVLWGTGENDYGQLGFGIYETEKKYEEPIKIAEQVISVDASESGYFCIYLTENGDLYGIGLNYKGILLGEETIWYSSEEGHLIHEDYQKVSSPILLMRNVAYAKAGDTSIAVLQKDKTAYWWGEYNPIRPQNMYSCEPVKVMENCRYITTGIYNGAAINENGELYTWGWNILGACGTEIAEDEFVRTPIKVLDDVKMVWVNEIGLNPVHMENFVDIERKLNYHYNIFALTNDNKMFASGMNVGDKERVTDIAILLELLEVYRYSDVFVPIQVMEYAEYVANYPQKTNQEVLNQLIFGMRMQEVEQHLLDAKLDYSFCAPTYEDSMYEICIENSRYFCSFDENGKLFGIYIQEGKSRDGRFTIGMTLTELEQMIQKENGVLEHKTEKIYSYQDLKNQIEYEFFIYENQVSHLYEKQLLNAE